MPLIIIEKEGLVDTTYVSTVNPVWVAANEFKRQGYSINFELQSTDSAGRFVETEEADIVAPDPIQAADLRHRFNILKELPDFSYLSRAYLPFHGTDVLEQIAAAI